MAARKLEVVFVGDTRQLEGALKRVDSQASGLGGTLQATGRKMTDAGQSATKNLSLPLAGIGTAAIKLATDFDQSMTNIEALVGVSRKQVDAWSKDILALSRTLPQSPKELADALYFVTSSGVKASDAMSVLKASARAAAAGLGSTQTVADAVTSAMNAYGSENLSAARATDVLLGAVKYGKGEPEDLAAVFGRVIPIAQEMGVSFDQVGAGLSTLTLTVNNAEESATQLSQTMQTFLKPSKKSADALKKLGFSVQEMRDKIRNKGLLPSMLELRDATKKYGVDVASVFPNIRALRGFLSLTGQNADENQKIFKSLATETGLVDDAFAKASQGPAFKFKAALSSLQAAGIELGNVLIPIVVPVISKMAATLDQVSAAFQRLSPWQQKIITDLGLLAVAFGPVLTGIGFLFSGLGRMVSAVMLTAKALQTFFLLLRAAPVLLGPSAPIIAGALAAGAAAIVLYKNWDTVKDGIGAAWDWLKAKVTPTFSAISDAVTTSWNAVKTATTAALSAVKSVVTTVFSAISAAVGLYLRAVVSTVTTQLNVAKAIFTTVWDAIRTATSTAFSAIRTAISTALSAIKAAVSLYFESYKTIILAVWAAIRTVATTSWNGIRSAIVTPVETAVSGVLGRVRGLRDSLVGVWGSIKGSAGDFAGDLRDKISGAFKGAVNAVIGFVNSIFHAVNMIPGVPNIKDLPKLATGGVVGKDPVPGFARGGVLHHDAFAKGGEISRPMVVVGEEAPRHNEYVIPTNPAYRTRALGLYDQLGAQLGVPGYKKGGVLGSVTGAIGGALGGAKDAAGNGIGALGDLGSAAINQLVSFAEKGASIVLDKLPGVGDLPTWIRGLGSYALDKVTGYAKQKVHDLLSGGTPGSLGPAVAIARMVKTMNTVAAKHFPYVYGGGHGGGDGPFDCSGLVSYILKAGGLIDSIQSTDGLKTWGLAGDGKYVTVGVRGSTGRNAHTMMRIGNKYLESGSGHGAAWTNGWSGNFPIHRHPPGLRKGGLVNDLFDPNQVGWGLARGGIVSAGSFAQGGISPGGWVRVGEVGAEWAQLPKGTRVHSASDSERMGPNAGPVIGEVHIHQEVDERVIARELAWQIKHG